MDLSKANVQYASSNPNVAKVSPNGTVTMVAHGTVTISATVNGVTGSTPVVAQQPFSVSAPSVVHPGDTFTATTKLPAAGSSPLSNVNVTLTAPSGWTVKATSPSSFSSVPGGQTATTTWAVTVPSNAQPGSNELDAAVTFTDANGPGSATTSTEVSVPYSSFTSAFNNPGISDDSNTAAGNLDGGGFSYSAQALAGGTPSLTPGATVTHDGQTFTWPNAQPGTPDNVVATGQTFAVSGSGSTLGFLGTGDYGTASGTGAITYTNGTVQPFSLTFADWWANSPVGGGILTTVPYINTPTGHQNQHVSIYYTSVPLQAGKTVAYVTLPIVNPASQGSTAMHIFAVAIG